MRFLNYLYYFIFSGLYVLLFFLIISIFGSFIFYKITKKLQKGGFKRDLFFLEKLFLSFGMGLSIYISISYFLSYFKLFNFYFCYLPFLIFDFVYVFNFVVKNKEKLKAKFNKEDLKIRFFNLRNLLLFFTFLTIFFIFFIFVFWKITLESIGLIRLDTYIWTGEAYYLLNNDTLNLGVTGFTYPSGYTIFIAGSLLISSDSLMVYFFVKMSSIYLMLMILLISYIIFKKLFKKHYLIFGGLLLILISEFFLRRFLYNTSSFLASLMISISFILIINKYPDYVLGFFLACIFLIHPLNLLFYLIPLFFFISTNYF